MSDEYRPFVVRGAVEAALEREVSQIDIGTAAGVAYQIVRAATLAEAAAHLEELADEEVTRPFAVIGPANHVKANALRAAAESVRALGERP